MVGARRDPGDSKQMGNAQRFSYQPVLRVDQIAPVVERELHLEPAVGGAARMLEASLRCAQRIRADDEVLVSVERSAGPDHVIELVMVQGEAVLEQDGVVPGGVQLAVSDIG